MPFIEGALEKRSHDARLNELPVGLARFGKFPPFFLGQFKDGRFLEEVAVEVTDFVGAETAAFGHLAKKVFKALGKEARVIDILLGEVAKDVLGQQADVLGKQAENDAVEETGDAQVLLLPDLYFLTRAGVAQLNRLAVLKGAGDGCDLGGERFGDFAGGF